MAGKGKKEAKKEEGEGQGGGKISFQVFPGKRCQVDIKEGEGGEAFTLKDLLEQEGQDAQGTTVKVNGEDTIDLDYVLKSGDSVVLLENVEGG
ncbi:MoaD/ThiS family protein [Candidatus Uhrbacteria bacterium]|nr:MoaD/ThiS family protein [Candidatus Uhrbacteria bacterium]